MKNSSKMHLSGNDPFSTKASDEANTAVLGRDQNDDRNRIVVDTHRFRLLHRLFHHGQFVG